MAILKCKMCGGDLNIIEGETVAVCEYCDTKQTVPTADNEKKMTLFARANRLRAACEFDKASGIYESIVADFPEEAEAYWGLVLCKFGIEYVDDPATGKKLPTCHRSSFDSIMDDSDFEQVLENADALARRVYREEAKAIEELRKNIIEVSSKEEPYDIFICYKETDENGSRTIDSVIAQDVYDALTEKGYRVFFSRITLEDKLGREYEPYIFAALNSAKVMLAFGTDYEYYNAVWVKNEWSRFLALIAKGEKKTLIPCYKGIDAYDMPKEFRRLQAQDMGKVGAIQDLLRGIGKIIGTRVQPAYVHTGSANNEAESMKQRGYMALEDGEIEEAKRFFERALDINPSDARAYLGKFLSQYGFASLADFDNKVCIPEDNKAFKRAEQFADPELAEELRSFKEENSKKIETLRFLDVLKKAVEKEIDYTEACTLQESGDEKKLTEAAKKFRNLKNYKDSNERAKVYEQRLTAIRGKFTPYRKFIKVGYKHTVGLKSDGKVVAVGDNDYGQCNVENWSDIVAIEAGTFHTVGLKSDGTVVAVGENKNGQCSVESWTDIVSIAAELYRTVGLKSNGTVVSTKIIEDNLAKDHSQCDVENWTDIVAIAASFRHTVGLKSDGTVVAVGDNKDGQCDVSDWKNIVSVTAGDLHTVGLKSDGTVVAVGRNKDGQCNVENWTSIVSIVSGGNYTFGLKSDGTVVAVGNNYKGQCDVKNWTDIMVIAKGYQTVGLKSDGTVVAVGDNDYGQCNVDNWTDIVAIAAGSFNTVGVKSDGTVVAVGDNYDGQCNVDNWKLFKSEKEKEADYNAACKLELSEIESDLKKAVDLFKRLKDYKDSAERTKVCQNAYEKIKADREERERAEEATRKERERAEAERRRAEEAARRKREREEKNAKLNAEKVSLQNEVANLKGIFSGKRRKQIEARLAEIDKELNKL